MVLGILAHVDARKNYIIGGASVSGREAYGRWEEWTTGDAFLDAYTLRESQGHLIYSSRQL